MILELESRCEFYFCAVFLFLWRDPLIVNIQIAIRIIIGSDKQKISMAPLDFGLGLASQVKFVVDLLSVGLKGGKEDELAGR